MTDRRGNLHVRIEECQKASIVFQNAEKVFALLALCVPRTYLLLKSRPCDEFRPLGYGDQSGEEGLARRRRGDQGGRAQARGGRGDPPQTRCAGFTRTVRLFTQGENEMYHAHLMKDP